LSAKAVLRPEVESFYSFSKVVVSEEHCRGLACYVARSLDPRRENGYPEAHTFMSCLAASTTGSQALPELGW